MNYPLDEARKILLEPGELTENQLEHTMNRLLGRTVDSADIYFQNSYVESWSLEEGIVKSGSYHIDRGFGVRVNAGEKTGFAYSDDLILPSLEQAAATAKHITTTSGQGRIHLSQQRIQLAQHYPATNPLNSIPGERKIDLLKQIDKQARLDPRVTQVQASLVGCYDVILIVNSNGLMSADIRPLVRVNVQVIVEQKGRRESGYAGGGGRTDYHFFLEQDRALAYTREAVKQATLNLEAEPSPAGTMTVVVGPGRPGVLLHEAVGHGLEGDFNRKEVSTFSGRIGEKVAAAGVTVVDNGTLPGKRGSLSIDDEGTQSQSTVLIENGVLKGYMLDQLNARLMGKESTGNGRRESYAHLPIPRMTNTYMQPGPHSHEEIISSVDKGIYAVDFSGGQVDITSGKFVFSMSEAYLIEKGKVTRPIKGATLIGNGPDVLHQISMIGNNLELDSGTSTCGKEGQWVPVGVGQPTLKLDAITVGGTQY